MMMPIMDGSAFIHALRHMNPNVKIIAASGLNAKGEEVSGPKAETKYFLTKPYTAETLLNAIRAILDDTLPARRFDLNP
jgi:DNA-binding response OmpR family regulator